MSQVKLISITPNAEQTIVYCARVSNPANQDNDNYAKLLHYCMKHRHWSVFEMAWATFEIETSRAISAQILRHRTFSFQEFSQRYAKTIGFEPVQLRRQDTKNRQNSIDDLPLEKIEKYQEEIDYLFDQAKWLYQTMLDDGIAKECARMVLPMTTKTRLYMTGTIRSWIHYIEVRTDPSTQKEHREIAEGIKKELAILLPTIADAAGWTGE